MTQPTVVPSARSYSDTIARLKNAIVNGGARLFAEIDQAKAASEVGLNLRPTTLLVFGNPKGGTPLMDAFPLSALDLPLKLLIWEDNEKVSVAYMSPRAIAERYGITGKDALIAAMEAQLVHLAGSVAS